MDIVNFGHFKVVNPNRHIIFYENEDGLDWYTLRAGLTTWTEQYGEFVDAVFGCFVTVNPDGIVIHVEYNPSRIVPDNKTVLGIDTDHKSVVKGMIWDGEKLLPPTKESLEVIGPPIENGV